jgi:tRNA (guanine26-N2/guanine27-N2)-dimethyltransferase
MDSTKSITEGSATVCFKEGKVFYNKVQEFNRDLSILAINSFQKHYLGRPVKIAECLSATGLRSLRYAKEIDSVDFIVANDLDAAACEAISRNVASNLCEKTVRVSNFDAKYVNSLWCA